MTHQFSYCRCGNPQHWPANAKIGDVWTCRRCGCRTRLVAPGTPGASRPGVIVPSLAPRRHKGAPRFNPAPGRPPVPSLARTLRRLFAALGR